MRRPLMIAIALALGAADVAAAQTAASQRPCISERQSEALVAYLLPVLVPALALRCGAINGASGYLPRNAARLSARFGPGSLAAWPDARSAVERISRQTIPATGIEASFAQAAIGPALAAGIAAAFTAESCGVADRLLADLEPLPPANFASVMALFIEIGIADRQNIPFRVCAAPAAVTARP